MDKPRASVIITTHNRPDLLPRAIESARASAANVEVIVVDDASNDRTREVCRKFAGIHYVRLERNQGVSGARNVGLAVSSGEYLTFLDDDDARLPSSLDRQIDLLNRRPEVGLVYGQAIVEQQDGTLRKLPRPLICPEGDVLWRLLTHNFMPCGSVVFRRACLSAVGLLDSRVTGPDDWDLWVRISELFPIAAVAYPVVIWHRSTPASAQGTSDAGRMAALGIQQFEQWMDLPRVAAVPSATKRELWRGFSGRMLEHLAWQSIRAIKYRRPLQAGHNLFTVRKLHPLAVAAVVKDRSLRSIWQQVRDELSFEVSSFEDHPSPRHL